MRLEDDCFWGLGLELGSTPGLATDTLWDSLLVKPKYFAATSKYLPPAKKSRTFGLCFGLGFGLDRGVGGLEPSVLSCNRFVVPTCVSTGYFDNIAAFGSVGDMNGGKEGLGGVGSGGGLALGEFGIEKGILGNIKGGMEGGGVVRVSL